MKMQCAWMRSAVALGAAFAALAAPASAQFAFDAPVSYPCGVDPHDVAVGDFDADGDLDLLTTLHAPARLSLLRNLGDATFAAPEYTNLSTAVSPEGVIAPDLDADGYPDVVVASYDTDQIVFLHNLGDAHLAPIAQIGAGNGPSELAAGDIDGDRDLDVVVANTLGNTLTVLRNVGSSQFEVVEHIAVTATPKSLAFARIFARTELDLVVAVHDAHAVCVLDNDGDGHFTLATTLTVPSGGYPECVDVADFDEDGDDDLAAIFSATSAHKVAVYYQVSVGTFSAPACFNVGSVHPSHIVAADFDLDTRVDLAIVSATSSVLTMLRNLGGNLFGMQLMFDLPGPQPDRMQAADLDGDHFIDLVCTNNLGSSLSVILNARTNPSTYCLAVPNSTGVGAHIGAAGSVSIAQNNLTLLISGAPPDVPGLFFYGHKPTQSTFQGGYLCVAAPVARLSPLAHVDRNGNVSYALQYERSPLPIGSIAVQPDSVWNFQFWYRDYAAGGAHSTNLSDGLRIYFEP